MQDKQEFRLILSNKSSAKTNMAIDKALVNTYRDSDKPIFRLYTWEKSFTVGLSQETSFYKDLEKEYNYNCSKRITGGGVLFHGHDISYSLILPSKMLLGLNVKQSYEKICQFILKFYEKIGLKAIFVKDMPSISLSKSEFCQVGYEAYDILINGIKIGGNAQKRTKTLIFQHGSIPVEKTESDEKIGTSLKNFKINLTFDEIKKELINSFEEAFNVKLKVSHLTKNEEEEFKKIIKGK